MKGNDKQIEDLALVIRSLADVWQNDKDEITLAGATFEKVVEDLQPSGVQLNKLIDLAWQGMRHLYEEDDFFMSVKNATMQGVNTIREFLIMEGDISVDEFESSCNLLEKALSGNAESADKIIEMNEENSDNRMIEDPEEIIEKITELNIPVNESTLDDCGSLNELASKLMELDESSEHEHLISFSSDLKKTSELYENIVAEELYIAHQYLQDIITGKKDQKVESWFEFLSERIEAALKFQEDETWDKNSNSDNGNGNGDLIRSENSETNVHRHIHSDQTEPDSKLFLLPMDIDLDMVYEFVTECNDLIETAESALLELEDSPDDNELINTVFRAFHTIKGTSAFMGLEPISEFTHFAETLLSMVRDGELPFDQACADISFNSIDIIKKLLAIVEVSEGGDPLPKSEKYLRTTVVLNHIAEDKMKPSDALKKAGSGVDEDSEQQATAIDLSIDIKKKSASVSNEPMTGTTNGLNSENGNGESDEKSRKSDQESTVRVNLGRLDRLIDMVGELVIAHSVVSQDSSVSKDSELMKKVNHTSKILRELQDTSLTLRMVPLKATFHKMNRLVRDLARKAGKEVKLYTMGDETEIDRNMVDIINEPLVHMLRNSIDHGVETPDQRAASEKPATATVWLRAYQKGGKVVIEIEDDGKGIDKEKILKKAIEKGLVNPDKQPTDNEICGFIFHPGLSSVDKVTDMSGRGVGMDVVRRSIDQLQGKVEVESEDGKGTKVTLELPFTLAITDGMLVRVGEQRFIIPTISIDMTFRSKKEDIFTIMGNSEHVKYRGNSVPIIRLYQLFSVPGAIENLEDGTLLVVKNNNKLYALLVDEIIGQQQLVGKSINMNVKVPHISGGAILGDGKVGLILDTAAVTT